MPLKWILGLYPPAWRRRYQEEMLALLEQHHVTWRTTIDLLLGALEARFDPHFQAESGPVPEGRSLRLRRVHSTIFWAFPLLVLGHLLFLDTLDDVFYPWNREHAALWRFKAISGAITAVGFIALMLTGLLLAWTLAKPSDQGLGTRRRMVPLGCFVVALASCALFPYVPRAIGRLFPIFLAGSPLPLAFAISRMELPPRLLRYALAPVALAVAGMAAQSAFVAVWGFAIWDVSAQAVQQMVRAADRPLWPGGMWHVQLLSGVLWMALMTGSAVWRFGQVLPVLRQDKTAGTEAS